MEDSILITIKQMLGLGEDETPFDPELITHINAGVIILSQLGVGTDGFFVSDACDTWTQLVSDVARFNHVKQYLYLYVRTVWDPPSAASVLTAYQETMKKLEFYIQVSGSQEVSK